MLGLRLLALAAVAGSAAFLPISTSTRLAIVTGILIGVAIGLVQLVTARRRFPFVGEAFVLAQVAVWTYLARLSGGQHSPLLVGLLLEIPLAGALLSRRGCVLAAGAGIGAYVACAALFDGPIDFPAFAIVVGFIAVTTLLATLLIRVLERQQREIDASHAALNARADNLSEELRLLGDYLNGGLLTLDSLGRVASINRVGLDFLGSSHEAVVGRPWQEVLRPDASSTRTLARSLSESVPRRGLRLLLLRADGRPADVEAELWVAPSAQGWQTFLLFDHPRRRDVEDDPLRRLGEASACVSHQIKNSLHALQGFASEIEHQGGARTRSSVRGMLKALGSLADLAGDVLVMTGAPCPDEPVPIRDVLSSAVVLARHPSVRVQVMTPPDELYVRGHRGRLVHALFNLIDNACRVSPPGATVAVRVTGEAETVEIEVADRGPGMPGGVGDAPGRAPSTQGSGYGLLAARRFLEAQGGRLTFDARAPVGTVCRVSLPIADLVPNRTWSR